MVKIKTGETITLREFFKRWKRGIESVTPLQQAFISLLSMNLVFAGIFWGIVITWMADMKWLTLILFGSFVLTLMNFVGTLQKYWKFKEIDKIQKEVMKNDK